MNNLVEIETSLAEFLNQYGKLQHLAHASATTPEAFATLFSDFSHLLSTETFQQVAEAVKKLKPEDEALPRQLRLLEHLATHREEAQSHPAKLAQDNLEATSWVRTDSLELTLESALQRLAVEPHSRQRNELEKASADVLGDHPGPYRRRLESSQNTARKLGFSSYFELRQQVDEFSYVELKEEAKAFLVQTEAAYRDLLSYVLKKVDPTLKMSEARRHHAVFFSQLPFVDAAWNSVSFFDLIRRWLETWGLHAHNKGHLRIVRDGAATKPTWAAVACVEAPKDVRLWAPRMTGLTAAKALLTAFGQAEHLAHVSSHLPLIHRMRFNRSIYESSGQLFRLQLHHSPWLQKQFECAKAAARDLARLTAFVSLLEVRKLAALLPYAESAYEGHVSSEDFVEQMNAAWRVEFPRGFFLHDLTKPNAIARQLKAVAWANGLHWSLQGRFNEDYFRNPAAASWLQNHWANSWLETPTSFEARLGATASLQGLGQTLLDTLGAR